MTTIAMEPLVESLLHGLRRKNIDALSAVCILQEAVLVSRKKGLPRDAVEQALRRIAAGKDGETGTPDDVVPPATVEQLMKLLDTGLVGDLVDALSPSKWWCCF